MGFRSEIGAIRVSNGRVGDHRASEKFGYQTIELGHMGADSRASELGEWAVWLPGGPVNPSFPRYVITEVSVEQVVVYDIVESTRGPSSASRTWFRT